MELRKIPYRLITFDVTNTLLNFKENVGKTYSKVGSSFGVNCEEKQLSEAFRRQFKKLSANHPNFGRASSPSLGWENWWRILVQKTFHQCQNEISESQIDLIYAKLMELYKSSQCWEPAFGAFELLGFLKSRGVILGVISNFDPRLHDVLINLNMKLYFNFVLTSYEVGFTKPHHEIFDKAIEESRISNLLKRECLHIGNTFNLDYVGATRSGWNSILITPNGVNNHQKLRDKNELFKNLNELQIFLENGIKG